MILCVQSTLSLYLLHIQQKEFDRKKNVTQKQRQKFTHITKFGSSKFCDGHCIPDGGTMDPETPGVGGPASKESTKSTVLELVKWLGLGRLVTEWLSPKAKTQSHSCDCFSATLLISLLMVHNAWMCQI